MGGLTKGNQVLRPAQGGDRIGRFGLLLCTIAVINYLRDDNLGFDTELSTTVADGSRRLSDEPLEIFSVVELKGDRMFG